MLLDQIQAFAGGISSAWNRTLFGLALILFSIALASFFVDDLNLMVLVAFPYYLFGYTLAWGHLVFISIPLLLLLASLFIYAVRFGFSKRLGLWIIGLPFLLVVVPFWLDPSTFESVDHLLRAFSSSVLFVVFVALSRKSFFRNEEA
jgi:hypothetical protein